MLPNIKAPEFIKDPHFYIDDNGFHLRDGASPEVVREFEKFIETQKEAEKQGVAL